MSASLGKLFRTLNALLLNTAEQRKLDAFHVRCLRKVLRIPHSYVSRISNETVLTQAGMKNLSKLLLNRQLDLMRNLALRNDSDILRQSVFKPGSFELKLPHGPKKRGRPKKLWAHVMLQHAVRASGSMDMLTRMWQPTPTAKAAWNACRHEYCK